MMKKFILPLGLASILLIAACGVGSNQNAKSDTTSNITQTTAATDTSQAAGKPVAPNDAIHLTHAKVSQGLVLMTKSDCNACHKEKEKLVGPAFIAIAEKYPDNDANTDKLTNKIIKGGSGTWGNISMPPHPQLSEIDAKMMVNYILSLK